MRVNGASLTWQAWRRFFASNRLRRSIVAGGDDPQPVRAKRRQIDVIEGDELGTSLHVHTFAIPSSLQVRIRDPSGLNEADPRDQEPIVRTSSAL